jgi:hypothetical protein
MLLHPIHGQPDDVLANSISNLRGFMRRILPAGGSMLLYYFRLSFFDLLTFPLISSNISSIEKKEG